MASSPWAVYQSPRSNIRTVSSPTAGKDLKKRMKPPSSSSYRGQLGQSRFDKLKINTLSSGRDAMLQLLVG